MMADALRGLGNFGVFAQAIQGDRVVGAHDHVLDRGRTSDFRFRTDSEHYFWTFFRSIKGR